MKPDLVTIVFITGTFPAVHCWPDCPFEEVSFLKTPHRHLFHYRMEKRVYHNDRDVEFFMFKNEVDSFIRGNLWNQDLGAMSCEMIATKLLEIFKACKVEISEDGENGAVVQSLGD